MRETSESVFVCFFTYYSFKISSFPSAYPQTAVTRAGLHIRSVTPGGDPTRREATCWSVSVWVTAKESGPANLSVSHSQPAADSRMTAFTWSGKKLSESFDSFPEKFGMLDYQIKQVWLVKYYVSFFFFLQLSVAMTTRRGHPTLSGRPGRSRIRAGWWWTAPVWEREVDASHAPPEVRSPLFLSLYSPPMFF